MSDEISNNKESNLYSNKDFYPEPQFVELINNKGEKIKIAANATIKDLVKMGMRDIGIEPEGAPMKDGYYYSF